MTSGYLAARRAQINDINTGTSGSQATMSIYTQAAAASNSTAFDFGLLVENAIPSTQTVNYQTKTGINGSSYNAGSGTVGILRGGLFTATHAGNNTAALAVGLAANGINSSSYAISNISGANIAGFNSGTGSASNLYGVNSGATNSSTGTVSNAYGLYSSVTNSVAGGTITTAYGLYLTKTNAGTITNNYGIYQADTSTNYFNGNVGIGTAAPAQKLDVYGNIAINGTSICTSAGCTSSSDRTLKENIQPLQKSLDKVLKLQGVEYDYKDKQKFTDKHQIGVIAQDVEKVYPEVVLKDSKTGLRSVAYDHLVGPLIEAFKSLYGRLVGVETRQAAQEREIASLKEENAAKARELKSIKAYLCAKDPNAPICH